MEEINRVLKRSIEDILTYDKENAVEGIMKTVFETILNLEREDFLSRTPETKGNGYYPRLLKSINSHFKLNIPRDRLSLFKPVFLEAIKSEESKRMNLAHKLYVKGLSTRDIEDVFKEVFNNKLSASSVSNINKRFLEERDLWLDRPLEEDYYFIFIDALFVSVRRDTVEKEAFYTVIGLRKDLKRDILGVYNLPHETIEGWRIVFKDLKRRGFKKTLMVVADGIPYLENVVSEELPTALFQKCLVHKIRHIILRVRSKDKAEIAKDFKSVFLLETNHYPKKERLNNLQLFLNKWQKHYPFLRNMFKDEHLDYYFNYLEFPSSIQRMIYTTNWIERLHKAIRKTMKIRNSMPNPDSALNLICAYLIDFERRVYNYPVTNFIQAKDSLDDKLFDLSQTQ